MVKFKNIGGNEREEQLLLSRISRLTLFTRAMAYCYQKFQNEKESIIYSSDLGKSLKIESSHALKLLKGISEFGLIKANRQSGIFVFSPVYNVVRGHKIIALDKYARIIKKTFDSA